MGKGNPMTDYGYDAHNRRHIDELRCPTCGVPFHPTGPKQIYCSPRCGRAQKVHLVLGVGLACRYPRGAWIRSSGDIEAVTCQRCLSVVKNFESSNRRSRQQAWRDRMRAAGKCVQCGKLRDGTSRAHCRACAERLRVQKRKRLGLRAKSESGLGRPIST